MPNNENEPATETKEALNRIEEILSGSISFVGLYLATIWHYLRYSSLSANKLKNELSQEQILKPLSFLLASLLFFILSYFRVLKELHHANWLNSEINDAVQRIVEYHDLVAQQAFDFQIADALMLMIPIVLFVAVFAKLNEIMSILIRKRTSVEQQLNSISYFLGCVISMLAIWSLPLLYFMANYNNLQNSSALEIGIGFVIMLIAVTSILTAIFRYLHTCNSQYYNNWPLTLFVFITTAFLQIIVVRVAFNFYSLT